MKLVAISLHNHLSHADTRVEFNGTRLAAFVGPNGAGKSALLEAVKYVLWDSARARTDQLVRLGETDMSATIEFEYSGSTYRAVRGRTTKGAGKSYLELHVQVPDGSWTPLTGDDIRDTQATIAELLGLDAETFATAVFLGQGEADRFAEATAGERKRILGTVLGLDVYARAEARARDDARDIDARSSAERAQIQRLEDAIAELEPVVRVRDQARERLAELERSSRSHRAERERLTARLTEVAGEIGRGDAAAAEVARLEQERAILAERYRREKSSIEAADAAISTADRILADEPAIAGAAGGLEGLRAEMLDLERADQVYRLVARETEEKRRAVDALVRPYESALTAWQAHLDHERAVVGERVERGKAGTSVCEACGQPIGREQALEQLAAARERLRTIEANKPVEPLAIARERAALTRLESRLAALTEPDPATLAAARDAVSAAERLAARSGELDAARQGREAASAAKAAAEDELERIGAAGVALNERITAAREAIAGMDALLEEKARLESEARQRDESIDVIQREIRGVEAQLATALANLERQDKMRADVAAVRERLAAADLELARLRRLVIAFGVSGIPARIIESVLPELAMYANELLAELRPGMTLELRAQRAKRDGKGIVEALDLDVRDEVGERPLAVFSGGERMSVSLAIAVGLSRLVARRAGSAIRTLVVDEPDGLDADARRAFGQALRVLAHHGDLERVVLVSHHPDLAEYADTVWSVSKSAGGSVVTEAA